MSLTILRIKYGTAFPKNSVNSSRGDKRANRLSKNFVTNHRYAGGFL